MKCDVCGSDNLEGAAYCEDCGAKLVVTHAVVGASGSAAPPAEVTPPPVVSALPPQAAPQAPAAGASVQCPSCGADNPSSEAYCVDCGANLGTGGAADAPAPSVSTGAAPPPLPVQAAARLSLADGTKQFVLDKEITTMGRRSPADQIEPDVDLTDDDPESYVSRRHAQILRNDDSYVFEDVGSSNGSFVNDKRIQPGVQQMLKDGDKLRLGKTEFVFSAR